MERETRFRIGIVMLVVAGIVGIGAGLLYDFTPGLTLFFTVIGVGGLVIQIGGKTYVPSVLLSIGVFAAVIALANMATEGVSVPGLGFVAIAAAALARGYQFYRTHNT